MTDKPKKSIGLTFGTNGQVTATQDDFMLAMTAYQCKISVAEAYALAGFLTAWANQQVAHFDI